MEYIRRAEEIQYRTPYSDDEPYEVRDKKVEVALKTMIREVAPDLGLPQIVEPRIMGYTTVRRLFIKKEVPVYMPLINSFKCVCFDYLVTQGYPAEQVSVTVYNPPGQKIDRASNAARQLMGTEEGKKVLTEYVLKGNTQIEEDGTLTNELFHKAIRIICRQKENILLTLETKEDHVQRHQKILQELS